MTRDPSIFERADAWRCDLSFSDELVGQRLTFSSTWGLFSPERVDDGSRMLLEHIDWSELPGDCLSIDLGCGVGTLGLTAAKLKPSGMHTLIDKDFVAIDYAKKNAQQNALESSTRVLLSNGFSAIDLKERFDLVMSNLPAKASKEQHYLYLIDAYQRMKPGAKFYVVTINGLREFMKRSFTEVFGNSKKIKQGKTYTITLAERSY